MYSKMTVPVSFDTDKFTLGLVNERKYRSERHGDIVVVGMHKNGYVVGMYMLEDGEYVSKGVFKFKNREDAVKHFETLKMIERTR